MSMQNKPVVDPEMSREEFVNIRDFILEKSGMFFPENKDYLLKNRLSKRIGELGLKTFQDYFYHVKYDTSMKEFNTLMDLMTTNETSFFRNEPQLASFAEEALPLFLKTRESESRPKELRIWSAGCSTGEEPYTLAILISEIIKNTAGWRIEIIASDISQQVLTSARAGEYSGITLRNVSPAILNMYYDKIDDSYRVKSEVKALVKFSLLNLNDSRKLSMYKNFDFIFCRNVMIYFSEEVKKVLVRNFYNSLKPGGLFYIGHSESLHGLSKAFKIVYFKKALVYQKEAIDTQAKTQVRTIAGGGTSKSDSVAGVAGGSTRALDLLKNIKTKVAT